MPLLAKVSMEVILTIVKYSEFISPIYGNVNNLLIGMK